MSDSENLFEDYLKKHKFSFEKEFPVSPGNIDFKTEKGGYIVLCDVKEVRDWNKGGYAQILPQDQIRSDIRKLRKKFGRQKPSFPVILISMNFGTNFFTGVSIATALFGDIGFTFGPVTKINSGIIHLNRGNAALTKHHNTAISAIFGFDVRNQQQHCLFINSFACNPLPNDYFPIWKIFNLKPYEIGNNLQELSDIIFWPIQ
jgi:hypothetical protein